MLAVSMTATLSLSAAAPLRAATPEPAKTAVATASATKPARQCLTDLGALQDQLREDGYWLGASGYGYRYQVACEVLLAEARQIYGHYAAEIRSGHAVMDNIRSFRQAQLATAQPVAGQNVSYRADQLIGTEVLNPKGDELGSVDDLVLSPQSGKIAHLVIARGGLFGIDEKFVPVPWTHFKATAGTRMPVLDTTKVDMAAAPRVERHLFDAANDFGKESQRVDAYWSAHPAK